MRRNRRSRGFTLVELLLVIIIIATLAAIVVPRFTGRSEEARVAATKSQIKLFDVALELYAHDNLGKFPLGEQGLQALVIKPTSPPEPKKWVGPYLKGDLPKDPWQTPYGYECPGKHNPTYYDIWSFGPDGQEGGGDDIANWTIREN